jgi:tyrosinase
MLNTSPSVNTTLDFVIDFGFAAGSAIAIQGVMNTIAGPFYYLYV